MGTIKAMAVVGGVYFVIGAACAAGYYAAYKGCEKLFGEIW